ncbi:HAD family hydrolase [Candidatus Contendibacter odensensis]|uniref:Phosphoglycolate phosphatase 2 (PGP 2) n=1 Tax=Candidatus Contendobacter odensis Run_B_J11 TaxID=1400861 RepID=A0A7U7GAP0_9GAMM|nr:HAD-IA family hydrolase [Candidatus Contendobacter odensis]CDH44771.1 putative phosphoglycolate phosphatase 2 (PGP 2) [Candidatus Contendobacter odensis Run_B_J11]
MRTIPPSGVLFDLDGTLLDTAPDLAAALNRLRCAHGESELPLEAIRPTISQGSPGMLNLGFGRTLDDPLYPALNQRFLDLYREFIAVETVLFPGMGEVLAYLEANCIRWGVVTNKPGWLTEPLMKALNLWSRAACVVSGDTLSKRKPDPEPLWYACEQMGVAPGQSLYVGDAERDMQAGKQAGMIALVAGFGYLGTEDRPEEWGADGFLEQPADLFGWLGAVEVGIATRALDLNK